MKRQGCAALVTILIAFASAIADRLPVNFKYKVMPGKGNTISSEDRTTAAAVLDKVTSAHGMKETPHGPENVIRIYTEAPGLGFLMFAEDCTNHISVNVVGNRPRLEATTERLQFIEELEQGLRKQFGEGFRKEE